eukprot:scaffold22766_cov131-Cylindrotheca_fusiformis.AAC.1
MSCKGGSEEDPWGLVGSNDSQKLPKEQRPVSGSQTHAPTVAHPGNGFSHELSDDVSDSTSSLDALETPFFAPTEELISPAENSVGPLHTNEANSFRAAASHTLHSPVSPQPKWSLRNFLGSTVKDKGRFGAESSVDDSMQYSQDSSRWSDIFSVAGSFLSAGTFNPADSTDMLRKEERRIDSNVTPFYRNRISDRSRKTWRTSADFKSPTLLQSGVQEIETTPRPRSRFGSLSSGPDLLVPMESVDEALESQTKTIVRTSSDHDIVGHSCSGGTVGSSEFSDDGDDSLQSSLVESDDKSHPCSVGVADDERKGRKVTPNHHSPAIELPNTEVQEMLGKEMELVQTGSSNDDRNVLASGYQDAFIDHSNFRGGSVSTEEASDRSSSHSLSSGEIAELNELLNDQEDGRQVDDSRLYELELFDRWKAGEQMNDNDLENLADFRDKRKKQRNFRKEFLLLLEKSAEGEEIDDDRLYYLELYERQKGGGGLQQNEAAELSGFLADHDTWFSDRETSPRKRPETEGLGGNHPYDGIDHAEAFGPTEGSSLQGEHTPSLPNRRTSDGRDKNPPQRIHGLFDAMTRSPKEEMTPTFDDSSLSSGEIDELNMLLRQHDEGEDVDTARLYELDLFDKWQSGNFVLDNKESADLDSFRNRRQRERQYRREFQDLLDDRDNGAAVDSERLHKLGLFGRHTMGEILSPEEIQELTSLFTPGDEEILNPRFEHLEDNLVPNHSRIRNRETNNLPPSSFQSDERSAMSQEEPSFDQDLAANLPAATNFPTASCIPPNAVANLDESSTLLEHLNESSNNDYSNGHGDSLESVQGSQPSSGRTPEKPLLAAAVEPSEQTQVAHGSSAPAPFVESPGSEDETFSFGHLYQFLPIPSHLGQRHGPGDKRDCHVDGDSSESEDVFDPPRSTAVANPELVAQMEARDQSHIAAGSPDLDDESSSSDHLSQVLTIESAEADVEQALAPLGQLHRSGESGDCDSGGESVQPEQILDFHPANVSVSEKLALGSAKKGSKQAKTSMGSSSPAAPSVESPAPEDKSSSSVHLPRVLLPIQSEDVDLIRSLEHVERVDRSGESGDRDGDGESVQPEQVFCFHPTPVPAPEILLLGTETGSQHFQLSVSSSSPASSVESPAEEDNSTSSVHLPQILLPVQSEDANSERSSERIKQLDRSEESGDLDGEGEGESVQPDQIFYFHPTSVPAPEKLLLGTAKTGSEQAQISVNSSLPGDFAESPVAEDMSSPSIHLPQVLLPGQSVDADLERSLERIKQLDRSGESGDGESVQPEQIVGFHPSSVSALEKLLLGTAKTVSEQSQISVSSSSPGDFAESPVAEDESSPSVHLPQVLPPIQSVDADLKRSLEHIKQLDRSGESGDAESVQPEQIVGFHPTSVSALEKLLLGTAKTVSEQSQISLSSSSPGDVAESPAAEDKSSSSVYLAPIQSEEAELERSLEHIEQLDRSGEIGDLDGDGESVQPEKIVGFHPTSVPAPEKLLLDPAKIGSEQSQISVSSSSPGYFAESPAADDKSSSSVYLPRIQSEDADLKRSLAYMEHLRRSGDNDDYDGDIDYVESEQVNPPYGPAGDMSLAKAMKASEQAQVAEGSSCIADLTEAQGTADEPTSSPDHLPRVFPITLEEPNGQHSLKQFEQLHRPGDDDECTGDGDSMELQQSFGPQDSSASENPLLAATMKAGEGGQIAAGPSSPRLSVESAGAEERLLCLPDRSTKAFSTSSEKTSVQRSWAQCEDDDRDSDGGSLESKHLFDTAVGPTPDKLLLALPMNPSEQARTPVGSTSPRLFSLEPPVRSSSVLVSPPFPPHSSPTAHGEATAPEQSWEHLDDSEIEDDGDGNDDSTEAHHYNGLLKGPPAVEKPLLAPATKVREQARLLESPSNIGSTSPDHSTPPPNMLTQEVDLQRSWNHSEYTRRPNVEDDFNGHRRFDPNEVDKSESSAGYEAIFSAGKPREYADVVEESVRTRLSAGPPASDGSLSDADSKHLSTEDARGQRSWKHSAHLNQPTIVDPGDNDASLKLNQLFDPLKIPASKKRLLAAAMNDIGQAEIAPVSSSASRGLNLPLIDDPSPADDLTDTSVLLAEESSGRRFEYLRQTKSDEDGDGKSMVSGQLFDSPKVALTMKAPLIGALKARDHPEVAATSSSSSGSSKDRPASVAGSLPPEHSNEKLLFDPAEMGVERMWKRSEHLVQPENEYAGDGGSESMEMAQTFDRSVYPTLVVSPAGSSTHSAKKHIVEAEIPTAPLHTEHVSLEEEGLSQEASLGGYALPLSKVSSEEVGVRNGDYFEFSRTSRARILTARKSYLDFIIPSSQDTVRGGSSDVSSKSSGCKLSSRQQGSEVAKQIYEPDYHLPYIDASVHVDMSKERFSKGKLHSQLTRQKGSDAEESLAPVESRRGREREREDRLMRELVTHVVDRRVGEDPPADECIEQFMGEQSVHLLRAIPQSEESDDYSDVSVWAPPPEHCRRNAPVLPTSTDRIGDDMVSPDLISSSSSSGSFVSRKGSADLVGQCMTTSWPHAPDSRKGTPVDWEEKCELVPSWDNRDTREFLLRDKIGDSESSQSHHDDRVKGRPPSASPSLLPENKNTASVSPGTTQQSQNCNETSLLMPQGNKDLFSRSASEVCSSSSSIKEVMYVVAEGSADIDPESRRFPSLDEEGIEERRKTSRRSSPFHRAAVGNSKHDLEHGLGPQSKGKKPVRSCSAGGQRCAGCIILSCLVIAAVALAVLSFANKTDESVAEKRPSRNELDELDAFIRQSLTAIGAGPSLDNATSPESLALDWIRQSDPAINAPRQKGLQRFVLAVLYFATNGFEWSRNMGWLSDLDECEWLFPDSELGPCNNGGELWAFNLSSNNLMGRLPWNVLGMLSPQLLRVDLSDNGLSGEVPGHIGVLTQLKLLDLSSNQFSGSIPSEIGRLKRLEELNLGANRLGGQIPTHISSMTRLEMIRLSGNHLTGTIPSGLGLISSLSGVYLRDNLLTGTAPRELCILSPAVFEVSCELVKCECCTNAECLPHEDPLLALLVSVSGDDGLALLDSDSPQYAAFQWLRSPLHNGFLSNTRKIQRFALATVYFATSGDFWKSNAFWLTSRDECDWFSSTSSSSACSSSGELTELDLRDNNLSGKLPPEVLLFSQSLSKSVGFVSKVR